MAKIIYLDNAATSKVFPEVLDSYQRITTEYFANPSSIHALGQKSARLLETSRAQILRTLKLDNHEVIFTSGATEANNLAIKGYCFANKTRGNHIITNAGEHPSVLNSILEMEQFGFEVTVLPLNDKGVVEVKDVVHALNKRTILVSLMAVNNETGAINPLEEIGEILKTYPKIVLHADMAQAIGKVPIPLDNIDLFTFAGHKIHGLQGSGALIKRKNILLRAINAGGGQEYNLRSGTNTLALSASLAKALRLIVEQQKDNYQHIAKLRDRLLKYLNEHPDKYKLNSYFQANPYIVNFSLLNRKASVVVEALSNRNIMVSSLSACHSKKEKHSAVIYAMCQNMQLAANTIRISFSYENTLEEVDTLIANLEDILKEIKQ
jgi:cysteine desulfurase